MKQVLISAKGEIEVHEVPIPSKEQGFLLVENCYSLISTGTESSAVSKHGGWLGLGEKIARSGDRVQQVWGMVKRQGISLTWDSVRRKLEEYAVPGYSCVGRVVEVTDSTLPYGVGDLVACMGAGFATHSEYVVVPTNLVVRLEKGVDLKQAAFGALGCIAMQGIRRLELTPGETAGVIGLGLIGQLALQLLQIMGYRAVGIDLVPERAAKGREVSGVVCWGMNEIDSVNRVLELSGGHGLDGVILCASTRSGGPVNLAFDLCRQNGRVSVVGEIGLRLDRTRMYKKELELRMSRSYGPGRYDDDYELRGQDYPLHAIRWSERRNLELFIEILSTGKLNLKPLMSFICPVEAAKEGYSLIKKSDPNTYGVIIDYHADLDRAPKVTQAMFSVQHPHRPLISSGDIIRIGLIGYGGFMKSVHHRNLNRLKKLFYVAGVANRTGAVAEIAAQRNRIPLATSDYRFLLDEKEIDAVLIATRHASHAAIVSDALDAGKHVFVEKPMCLTVDEGDAIVRKADDTGLIVRVGFNRRFSPYLRELKRIVGSQGRRIFSCRVNVGSTAGDWSNTAEEGGRLVGEGVHFFDLCNWFMESNPIEMHAFFAGEASSTNPNVVVELKYLGGCVSNVMYTTLGHAKAGKELFEAFGNGNYARIEDYQSFVSSSSRSKSNEMKKNDKGHYGELVEFFAAVTGGPASCDGADAKAGKVATEIALRASESHWIFGR